MGDGTEAVDEGLPEGEVILGGLLGPEAEDGLGGEGGLAVGGEEAAPIQPSTLTSGALEDESAESQSEERHGLERAWLGRSESDRMGPWTERD